MFHFQAKKLLTAFLDEELSPEKSNTMKVHIHSCTRCQTELEELRKLNTLLGSIPKQESRTELYWQTQQKNILEKVQRPESEFDKKPLLEPVGKPGYWKFAVAGSAVMVFVFMFWFNVYRFPITTRTFKEPQSPLNALESYSIDHDRYPSQSPEAKLPERKPKEESEIANKNQLGIESADKSGALRRDTQVLEDKKIAGKEEMKELGYLSRQPKPAAPIAAEEPQRAFGEGVALKDSSSKKEFEKVQPESKKISEVAMDKVPRGKYESKPLEKTIKSSDELSKLKISEVSEESAGRRVETTSDFEIARQLSSSKSMDSSKMMYFGGQAEFRGISIFNDDSMARSREKYVSFNFQNTPVSKALEAISSTANVQILAISPQLEKQITRELKSISLESAIQEVGKIVNLPYATRDKDTYILSPQPIDLYTEREGFASSTNKVWIFQPKEMEVQSGVFATGYAGDTISHKYLCPVCKKIELRPEWTYCPLDGSKIDKSIFNNK